MMTIDSTTQLVGLIRSESERFKELVSWLTPEALENPSPCERWNVGEVIAHLIWFAEKYGGMVERGLKGDQSPLEGFPAVPGTLQGPEITKLYGDSAIELRRSLGDRLIPEFCERYDWLNDLLQGIGPDDWGKPCYHTIRIRPVESFVPTIIQELAVHDWDIRSTIDLSPKVSEATLSALLEKLPSNRRPWSVTFESVFAQSELTRLRFEFSDREDKRDVIVEGGKARIEPSKGGPADLTLTSETSDFVLLMYGRLTVGSALAAGVFTAEGELGLIPDIDRWLAGD